MKLKVKSVKRLKSWQVNLNLYQYKIEACCLNNRLSAIRSNKEQC
jgi:hypothetical protein